MPRETMYIVKIQKIKRMAVDNITHFSNIFIVLKGLDFP